MGAGRNAHRILVGKPEGKRPLRKTKTYGKWTILNLILHKMGWFGLIWLRIGISGRSLVNTVMNLRVT
jgi:hypothetical protein